MHIHIHIYIHPCTYTYICKGIHTYKYIYMHTYTSTLAYMHIYMYIYSIYAHPVASVKQMFTLMTYTYTHMHVHIHTHTGRVALPAVLPKVPGDTLLCCQHSCFFNSVLPPHIACWLHQECTQFPTMCLCCFVLFTGEEDFFFNFRKRPAVCHERFHVNSWFIESTVIELPISRWRRQKWGWI